MTKPAETASLPSSVHADRNDAADMTMLTALGILLGRVSPERRRALGPLLVLMVAGAVAEVVTIGALLPFLAAIADPQGSPVLAIMAPLLDVFGAREPGRAVYVLAGLFGLAAVVAAVIRLILLWASHSFVNGVSYELATRLYADALHQPYAWHAGRNSSEIIAAISKVQLVTQNVFTPMMQAVIATIISTFLIIGLIMMDPAMALAAGIGFAIIYLAATMATRPRLRRNSTVIARAQTDRIKAMQEGLGGIRDILLDQSQPVFVETYERSEAGFRDARTRISFLAGAPRYAVESASMILIALVAIVVAQRAGGLMEALPALGALALGGQKLLPLVQQMYFGWAQSVGNRQVLFDVAALLTRPEPDAAPDVPAMAFTTAIRLDKVDFAYTQDRGPALSGISLDIPKGARVGLAGKTGSGKSTLMDLILGLLEPGAGEISVDGVALTAANRAAWQKNIAHVPQFIYLADASVAQNIAFGVRRSEIDMERVRRAAEQAELAEVIADLPKGYDTRIGERGIQLSGGQRQRIGIARALYKNASVLVFDEATSALDTETETAVMDAIGRLDRSLTILIIAHRLSTLDGCDLVVQLDGGTVAAVKHAAPASST